MGLLFGISSPPNFLEITEAAYFVSSIKLMLGKYLVITTLIILREWILVSYPHTAKLAAKSKEINADYSDAKYFITTSHMNLSTILRVRQSQN